MPSDELKVIERTGPHPPLVQLLAEADRQMTICNACRYCEGYCAVFPAMELRREFKPDDLIYMANLCFDCRACYYACPYTAPHEWAVNVPEIMAAVREETYREHAAPKMLARLFMGSRLLASFAVVAIVSLVFALVLATSGSAAVFGTTGANFFAVVPYWSMVLPAVAVSAYALAVLAAGGVRFWRDTGGTVGQMFSVSALFRASKDALGLVYLKGGGEGCFYPDELPSMSRRWFHHFVFYGFMLDFASTTVAAFYDHFLDAHAPYALLSVPVVLGLVGGVMLTIGAAGLLGLKWRADRTPAHPSMLDLDVVFIGLLLATAVTGLLLLALRETAAMGTVLVVHLGIVAALFVTLPLGKFAHVTYRYAALVKNQIEIAESEHSA